MPLPHSSIPTVTLRQKIAVEIRRAILTQALLPGERVVERELAARLGASLTATREAVIQLEAEGFIVKKSNATTHIASLTRKDIEDIFAVRSVLEEYACEQASRNADVAEVSALRNLHAEAISLAQQGLGRQYIECDLAWHEAVWDAAHNSHLADVLRRVALPLFGFSLTSLAMSTDFDLVHDVQVHGPLMKAIEGRDAENIGVLYRSASAQWQMATIDSLSSKAADRDVSRR